MCKPLPGPRCSSHTFSVLTTKHVARTEQQRIAEAAAQEYAALTERDAEASRADIYLAHQKMNEEQAKLFDLLEAEEAAKLEWYSTPDGQEHLEQLIEETEDEQKREEYETLLENAKDTRARQTKAHHVAEAARKRLKDVPAEVRAEVAAVEHEAVELRKEFDALGDEALKAVNQRDQAQHIFTQSQATLRHHLEAIKAQHARIHEYVRHAYIQHGVPANLADHYALDTTRSLQKGWRHLNDSAVERIPVFTSDMAVKVKSDNEATLATREALAGDENMKALLSEAGALYETHEANTEALEDAYQARHTAAAATDSYAERGMDIREKMLAVERQSADLKATYVSGMWGKKVFDVSAQQFVKSAYTSPDGATTNASVLRRLGDLDVYVPVEKFHLGGSPSWVELADGSTMKATDLHAERLRVVQPPSGWGRVLRTNG